MSRKSERRARRGKSGRISVPRRNRSLPNRPLLVLALGGMALTAYLSANAWFGNQAAFCGAGTSCDLVQSSRWSVLFGLPIAFWGFLSYAALGFIALRVKRTLAHWTYGWIVALVGLAFSLYLTAISLFVVKSACLYCLASLALMTASFAVVAGQKPEGISGFGWPAWLAQTSVVAALLVGLLHLHYSGVFAASAGPEDPYLKALAIHLGAVGAKFYGASWCPHCNEQKDLFAASAGRLPYVECYPQGRGSPSAFVCDKGGIKDFPTWVIGSERYVKVLNANVLARHSGFEWKTPEADSDP